MQTTLPITVKTLYEKESSDAPFVAYSPELDVASAGPTESVARRNLKEAINLVLEGAKEDGNLYEFLEEVGFSKEKGRFKAPKIRTDKVPLPI